MKKQDRRKLKHWYMRFVGECPVCGRDQSYREMRYTPKPKKASDRVAYLPDTHTCDGCDR